jgi:hypothetical protein
VLSNWKQFVVASVKRVVKRVFILVMNFEVFWYNSIDAFINSDMEVRFDSASPTLVVNSVGPSAGIWVPIVDNAFKYDGL